MHTLIPQARVNAMLKLYQYPLLILAKDHQNLMIQLLMLKGQYVGIPSEAHYVVKTNHKLPDNIHIINDTYVVKNSSK